MTRYRSLGIVSLATFAALFTATSRAAQQNPPAAAPAPAPAAPAAGQGRGASAPAVVSPEVLPDRRITFRLLAPNAQNVRLNASDIPGLGQNGVLTKGENNVWSVTVGPVEPGAYRYQFNVDGVSVIDPRSPAT